MVAVKRTRAPALPPAARGMAGLFRQDRPAGHSGLPAAGAADRQFASSRPPGSNMPKQMCGPFWRRPRRSIWERL